MPFGQEPGLISKAGTWIVYPWYRARPPEGADLRLFPRSSLLADPQKALWHTFGMEWKEHAAGLAPILGFQEQPAENVR